MPDPMDTTIVARALRAVAASFDYHTEVEVLLVGGAAGMLTGVLDQSRTTIDCDVMVSAPPGAIEHLEAIARPVADGMGLPRTWLNGDASVVGWKLPDGWRDRRVRVLEDIDGDLRFFAASRRDLIALKALAGRDQDLEDLRAMRVASDEASFVRAHLDAYDALPTGERHRATIDAARLIIDAMEGANAS